MAGIARFSKRSACAAETNAWSQALRELRAEGRESLDLCVSNPTKVGLGGDPRLRDSGLYQDQAAVYEPDPWGSKRAREAIAAHMQGLGIAAEPARILLTAGTSEAYAFLFKLLCDPGDEVLAPEPSYPLLAHLAQLEAVRLVPYRLRYDGQWHLDLASIQAAIGPRTRALVVVHPNNPTGNYLKQDELLALAGLELPIISDEVFAGFPLRSDPNRATTLLTCSRLVFSLFGLSKLAALPQLKLSWLCANGPNALLEPALQRLELIADTFLSVGTPVQLTLQSILAYYPPHQQAIAARLRRNLAALRAATRGTAVDVLDVEGGWYAVLRVPEVQSDEAWALELVRRDSVIVHPGYFYDFCDGAYLVLSLITPEVVLDPGLARLMQRVDTRCR